MIDNDNMIKIRTSERLRMLKVRGDFICPLETMYAQPLETVYALLLEIVYPQLTKIMLTQLLETICLINRDYVC